MGEQQKIQDDAYSFPYHYIPAFDDYFRHFIEESWGMAYCASIEFIIDELKKVQFETLIDVGCGDGRLLREIDKVFNEKQLVGVDTSKKAISLANSLNPNMNFKNIDISKIDSKYDIVTLIEVLEHVPVDGVESFVFDLSNLLNDNGIALLTVPSLNRNYDSRHFQHFSVALLRSLFENRFNIEEVIYIERIPSNLLDKFIYLYLNNRYLIIKNKTFLSCIYEYYKKRFVCDKYCQSYRIFIRLKKRHEL